MAKKLLGDRSVGDVHFSKDQIITDEEALANGFNESDVVTVAEPVKDEVDVTATVDADADLDSGEKKITDESEQSGAKAKTADKNTEVAPKTIPHTLTEEDITNNPELTEQGLKAGDEVDIPAKEITITEEILTAHPEYVEQGYVVGGVYLIADEDVK